MLAFGAIKCYNIKAIHTLVLLRIGAFSRMFTAS